MAQKPLMLKDFLELDSNSESCAGFRCAPRFPPDAATMRCLLEAELGGGGSGGRLLRSRSKKAITKLSAVINALRLLRFSSPSPQTPGILPRSLSKRLRKSLWSKRGEKKEEEAKEIRLQEVRVRDIVRLGSFIERSSINCPSPVVSSCSSWSDTDSCSGSDFVRSSAGSSQCSESKKSSPPGTPSPGPNPNPNKVRKAVGVETAAGPATCHRAAKVQFV